MNNQKQTSFTVSKIYKSRKNLLNILEKRGFDISDYNNFGINEIQAMYANKQLDMLLTEKNENKKIYVKYHVTSKNGNSTFPKLRDSHINDYIDDLFNLEEILDKYDELENDVNFLSEFSQRGGKFADMAGFVRFNEKGEEVLSFGKYRDVTLAQIWKDNPGYFSWINQADFPLYTKNVMRNFATKMKLEKKL